MATLPIEKYEEEKLLHAKNWILKWGAGLPAVFLVDWSLLTIPAYAFTEKVLQLLGDFVNRLGHGRHRGQHFAALVKGTRRHLDVPVGALYKPRR